MDNNIAIKVLREVIAIAPNSWLFGGTLLGAIRDAAIIDWDGDIDLGHDSLGMTDDIVEQFKMCGFFVSIYKYDHKKMHAFLPNSMGQYGKVIVKKYGVKVEICCFADGINHDLFGEIMYYASGTPRFFILPKGFIYPMKKIRFYDLDVNIPVRYEDQLAFVYGNDWRTPKRNWYNTADHYLCRERTIIELDGDDKSKWSKWTGRKVIAKVYPSLYIPSDINTPIKLI